MKAKHKNKRPSRKGSKRPQNDGGVVWDTASLKTKVQNLALPLCISAGMELVHVELASQPNGRALRLYIDRPEGVTLEDCAFISRQLSDLLDVAIDGDWSYKLEVSSPGSNRPLGKIEDFNRFAGQEAKIKMAAPIDGQKSFTGTLAGASDMTVTVMVQGEPVSIPYKHIQSARLINYNGEL